MAQLVEQRIRNAWVPGSSPGIGSTIFFYCQLINNPCGNSSVGRALASQAGGRGFEPRLPLTTPLIYFIYIYTIYNGSHFEDRFCLYNTNKK